MAGVKKGFSEKHKYIFKEVTWKTVLYGDFLSHAHNAEEAKLKKLTLVKLMLNSVFCFNYIKSMVYFPQLFPNYIQYYNN